MVFLKDQECFSQVTDISRPRGGSQVPGSARPCTAIHTSTCAIFHEVSAHNRSDKELIEGLNSPTPEDLGTVDRRSSDPLGLLESFYLQPSRCLPPQQRDHCVALQNVLSRHRTDPGPLAESRKASTAYSRSDERKEAFVREWMFYEEFKDFKANLYIIPMHARPSLARFLQNLAKLLRSLLSFIPHMTQHLLSRFLTRPTNTQLSHATAISVLVECHGHCCLEQWLLESRWVRKNMCSNVRVALEQTHGMMPKEHDNGRRPSGRGNISLLSAVVCIVSSSYVARGRRAVGLELGLILPTIP